MKNIYIIGGTMGVGKTTICQKLKLKLANSVFLDGDWCWDMNPFQVTEETKKMVIDNIKEYEYYYTIKEPDPDEEIPILLHNNSVVEAFEGVTSMYSLPSRHDIDPTKVMAPFYFLFFGLMLSDAAS